MSSPYHPGSHHDREWLSGFDDGLLVRGIIFHDAESPVALGYAKGRKFAEAAFSSLILAGVISSLKIETGEISISAIDAIVKEARSIVRAAALGEKT